jgi:hypothetical protein
MGSRKQWKPELEKSNLTAIAKKGRSGAALVRYANTRGCRRCSWQRPTSSTSRLRIPDLRAHGMIPLDGLASDPTNLRGTQR